MTWQTRALASFIAATAMGDSKGLVEQAAQLSMEQAEETPAEPAPGSYERLASLVTARRPG